MDKVIQALNNFANMKIFTAVRESIDMLMAVVMLASVFLLIAELPLPGYESFMNAVFGAGWNAGFKMAASALFAIVSFVIAFGSAYSYAKNQEQDGISAGVLALVCFVILSVQVIAESGEELFIQGFIGANGIFAALIVGIAVGIIFTFFAKKNLNIKMPDGIPDNVGGVFSSMLPGLVILSAAVALYYVFGKTFGVSFAEFIFHTVQTPVQNFVDSWVVGVIIVVLMSALFWTGIHGAGTVMSIMIPIFTVNALTNQAILDAGLELTKENGAHFMTAQLIDCFVKFGGVGLTLGVLIAIIFAGRSKSMKEVYKMALSPGIFNINEPVIFGLPIVNNRIMRIPFVAVPLLAFLITYGAMQIGFLAPFAGVHVPWITPPILSGFLIGGIPGVIVQLVIIVMSAVVYLPFVVRQDTEFLKQETEDEKGE